MRDEFPKSAWLVSKIGRLTVGVQFDPKCKLLRKEKFVLPFTCLLINLKKIDSVPLFLLVRS